MNSHRRSFHKAGFTLVELLVVVGIIAVLVAILLPALNKAREQSRTVQCLSNMHQMMSTMYMYCNDNNGAMVWAFWAANGLPALDTRWFPIDAKTGYSDLYSVFSDAPLLGRYTHPDDLKAYYGHVPTNSIWHCPDDLKEAVAKGYSFCSYGLNMAAYPQIKPPDPSTGAPTFVNTWKITQVRSPSLMMSFIDSYQTRFQPADVGNGPTTGWYATVGPGGAPYNVKQPISSYNHTVRHGKYGTNVAFIDGHAETLQNNVDSSGYLRLTNALQTRQFVVFPSDQ